MFKFVYIFLLTLFCFGELAAQQNTKADSIRAATRARSDSMRAANKQRSDSIKAANLARTDSLKRVNQQRKDSLAAIRQAREDAAKAKNTKSRKKSKKDKDLDEYLPEDPKDSLTLAREARQDSLKSIRDAEVEKRKKELAEKRSNVTATRKKIIPPLTQELSVGFRLCSDGWSIFANRGFIKTENSDRPHTTFLWVDLSEKRHPKESRTMNENFSVVNPDELKPLSYKYGKINNFYQFKIGYGNIRPITGRLDRKSVVINWVYGAGLSLGLLKPYYLDLLVPEGGTYVRKFDKYTEANRMYFLDLNNQGTIIGGSNFTKGLNEIKLKPGLALRSGFYFDYSATRKTFLGVEIGASAEIYTQGIPIMADQKNTAYFFNMYADFRFGKRWE